MQVNLNNYKPIKKIVRLASVTCVALAIYGCSSVEENLDKEQAMTPEQQQLFILEKIESWSAAEPDIQRILRLEADMQLIVNQLASMAELDDDPMGNNKVTENSKKTKIIQNDNTPDEFPVNTDLTNTRADSNNVEEVHSVGSINSQQQTYSSPKISNNVKRLSHSMGHKFPKVGIHIAMFKSANDIIIGWKYLQGILPVGIVNKKPLLAKVNFEGREYYSLRVGPFKSVNSAKRTCLNLQQQQHYCSVVEFKGFSFN
jgi:PBP1b-binding outer membrane lipoprotein LpoB